MNSNIGAFSFKNLSLDYFGWLNAGQDKGGVTLSFDASRVSSLYQNGLTEIRVNALCGYMLIRYT